MNASLLNAPESWVTQLTSFQRTSGFIRWIRELVSSPDKLPMVIVDGGCSTGVGTIELKALFPSAHLVYGVDNQEMPSTDCIGYTRRSATQILDGNGRFKKEDSAAVQFIQADFYTELFPEGTVDIFLILNSISYLYKNDADLNNRIDNMANKLANPIKALNPNKGILALGINSMIPMELAPNIDDAMVFERRGEDIFLKGDESFYKDQKFSYATKKKLETALSEKLKEMIAVYEW